MVNKPSMLGILLLILALLFLAGTIVYAGIILVASAVEFTISSIRDEEWWGIPLAVAVGGGIIYLISLFL